MTEDDSIRRHFRWQAESCKALGSPFMACLLGMMATHLTPDSAFGARILNWPGDPARDALSLRAAGALNAFVRAGRAPRLASAWPPAEPRESLLLAGLAQTIAAHDGELTGWLDSPPQTNETGRAGAILGAALVLAGELRMPLAIFEIGASAGLNLAFDRYRYTIDEEGAGWGSPDATVNIEAPWRGDRPPPLDAPLALASRVACDLNPLDPSRPADRERLMAYIWADQFRRIARAQAALDLAAEAPWRVEKADAAHWLAQRWAEPQRDGEARVLVHTVMWQYMPEATRAQIRDALADHGARATPEKPLARISMEADSTSGAARLRLSIWRGGGEERRELGRADFHGRYVDWA